MSTPTRAEKRRAMARLEKLYEAAETAAEDLLVAVYDAQLAGVLSQANVAAAIGGVSPSAIRGRALKGKKIAEERKSA